MKTALTVLLFGAIIGYGAGQNFQCYSCSSTLTASSDCKNAVQNISTVACTSGSSCFSEVVKAGGFQTKIERGCKANCVTDDSCMNGLGTGICRICCNQDKCNTVTPGGAGTAGVSAALLLASSFFTILGAL
ncbi:PREDICTED: secreted Ly-6/uPAR-related protein 1-like [Branchiostoma belcheri]|uniref:Secreted Ly-6/uPAR-related protein 1-like n=1 Tax=Branchiostoma belcheri TaxID=7741 RepID=A0A6P4ZYV7_BRABE|nr:PREDICTED: secreted Ly-6/uPAR-related protein 1-like [Branchiostoma belcheri]